MLLLFVWFVCSLEREPMDEPDMDVDDGLTRWGFVFVALQFSGKAIAIRDVQHQPAIV